MGSLGADVAVLAVTVFAAAHITREDGNRLITNTTRSEILLKGFQLPKSTQGEKDFRKKLEQIQALRNNLAHANEYAASPDQARHVCEVVRELLALRETIADMVRIRAIRQRAHG